jgi:hypothetical protein
MTRLVTVFGTHGLNLEHPEQEWHHPQSAWWAYMREHGFEEADPDDPFIWSGDIDGTPFAGNDWEVTTIWLRRYLRSLPYEDRNVIAHSHGGQPAIEAAIEVPIRSLIMFGTPVRKRIEQEVCPKALPNIGACVQVIDERRDWTATLGGLFDGDLRWRREFKVPPVPGVHGGIQVKKLPKIGHSNILRDPAFFPVMESAGLLDVLTSSPEAAA